jgi:hypothetical protein
MFAAGLIISSPTAFALAKPSYGHSAAIVATPPALRSCAHNATPHHPRNHRGQDIYLVERHVAERVMKIVTHSRARIGRQVVDRHPENEKDSDSFQCCGVG